MGRRGEAGTGQPVFRPVDQRQIIGDGRLTDRSVARILKSRVHALLRLRGKTKAEADELVERFSGHSMRAGYVTSGAAMDIPSIGCSSTPSRQWLPCTCAKLRSGRRAA